MPCYTPLKAYQATTLKTPNGKKKIYFKRQYHVNTKLIKLSCGQCIGCRLHYSINWATRIMNEVQTTPGNIASFITLTYNDKNLPSDQSLRKHHFTDFIKKFRKTIHPHRIRYFMCGEYGEQTWRPHYHAIIFGYDFTKIQEYNKTVHDPRKRMQYLPTENPYYISTFLTKLWDKGNHLITDCTFETAAYVARYITKKITGKNSEEHYNKLIIDWNEFTGEIFNMQEADLTPEYATMSRRPGIGHEWYQKYKDDCFPSGYLIKDGNKIPVPRYYLNQLEKEDIVLHAEMQLKKEKDIINHAADLTPAMLAQRHHCKLQQSKNFTRSKL